jgi:hypothetical protein
MNISQIENIKYKTNDRGAIISQNKRQQTSRSSNGNN